MNGHICWQRRRFLRSKIGWNSKINSSSTTNSESFREMLDQVHFRAWDHADKLWWTLTVIQSTDFLNNPRTIKLCIKTYHHANSTWDMKRLSQWLHNRLYATLMSMVSDDASRLVKGFSVTHGDGLRCYQQNNNRLYNNHHVFLQTDLPSVLWHCWLGVRKSIRPVVLARLSVRSVVQMICIWSSWCHCHPSSLASVKSRMVYLSGVGLPRLSWKKGR